MAPFSFIKTSTLIFAYLFLWYQTNYQHQVSALSTLKDDVSDSNSLYSSEEDVNNGNARLKSLEGNGTNVPPPSHQEVKEKGGDVYRPPSSSLFTVDGNDDDSDDDFGDDLVLGHIPPTDDLLEKKDSDDNEMDLLNPTKENTPPDKKNDAPRHTAENHSSKKRSFFGSFLKRSPEKKDLTQSDSKKDLTQSDSKKDLTQSDSKKDLTQSDSKKDLTQSDPKKDLTQSPLKGDEQKLKENEKKSKNEKNKAPCKKKKSWRDRFICRLFRGEVKTHEWILLILVVLVLFMWIPNFVTNLFYTIPRAMQGNSPYYYINFAVCVILGLVLLIVLWKFWKSEGGRNLSNKLLKCQPPPQEHDSLPIDKTEIK